MKGIKLNESMVTTPQPINECVIAAKKLKIDNDGKFDEEQGQTFVLLKHRDRAYNVNCSIVHTVINDVEIVYLRDDDTYWQEGMNDRGMCIINSSLSLNDSSIGKKDKDKSKKRDVSTKFAEDGEKIVKALSMRNLDDAIHFAKSWKGGIQGNTLFATDDELFHLVNTSKHPSIVSDLKEVDSIIYTNHSDIHKDAGYQEGDPSWESTTVRKQKAEEILVRAITPDEMLEFMRKQPYSKGSQLNPLRSTSTLATTSQMMLDPKNLHFHLTLVKAYTENFKGIVDQCPTGWVKKIKITFDEI